MADDAFTWRVFLVFNRLWLQMIFNVDSPDKKDFLYPNREIIVLQQQDKKLQ